MKKIFIPLLLICRQGHAQDCEPIDSVIATIVSANLSELEYQSQLVQQFKVKNWPYFLPSIGYDLTSNRPLVHFSLSSYLNLIQRKKDLRYQLYQLQLQYSNQLSADTLSCRSYYGQFTDLLLHYYGELALLDSSHQLLDIKNEENRQLQATSEDVLKVKLGIEKSKLAMVALRNEIAGKALQISLLAKRAFCYRLPQ